MFTSEEPTRFGISCMGRCGDCIHVNNWYLMSLQASSTHQHSLCPFAFGVPVDLLQADVCVSCSSAPHNKTTKSQKLSAMCSRAMAGKLQKTLLTSVLDENGTSFMDAAAAADYAQSGDPEAVMQSAKDMTADIKAFVELHIQQGTVLRKIWLTRGRMWLHGCRAACSLLRMQRLHVALLRLLDRNQKNFAAGVPKLFFREELRISY